MFNHKAPKHFASVTVGQLRKPMALQPDPSTVVQYKDIDGKQQKVNPKKDEEEEPEVKKKVRPGEKLLKKLTRNDKTQEDKDKAKMKRIITSIRASIKSGLIE
jgi:hypothetical protein